MAEINDWKEVPIDDWKEVPIGSTSSQPSQGQSSWGMFDFLPGVQRGFINLAEGLKQRDIEARQWLGLGGPRESDIAAQQGQELLSKRAKRAPLPDTFGAKAGEFAGGVAPTLAIPGGAGLTLPMRMLVQGLTGAGLGYAQPTKEGESIAQNMAMGGAMGAGSTVALAPVGKAINAAKGALPKVYDDIIALGKKYDIPLSLGEIKNNPVIQKAETWLEAIPIMGINKFRQKQNLKAEEAGKKLLSNYIVDPNSPNIMKTNREFASGLFEDLKGIVGEIPNQKISVNQTAPIAQKLSERYPNIFKLFQDTQREKLIKNVIEGTEDIVISEKVKISPILDYLGREIKQTTSEKTIKKTLTFDEAWTLRDGLGNMIGQARKKFNQGEVDKTVISQLSEMYAAINTDIDNWAASLGKPEIRMAINQANTAYKNYVVKYSAIEEVMAKAEGEIGAGEIFSPKRMSTLLKGIVHEQKASESKLFSPKEIGEMTGLIKIMQTAKRGGQFMENPPTGNRWGLPQVASQLSALPVGMAIGGSPVMGAVTLGTEGTIAGIARFLTTTEAGKRLSLAASNLEPNSPEMLNIIYSFIPKAMSTGAVQSQGNRR
jgi:hypothetical protein